jgi:hypothetical protein
VSDEHRAASREHWSSAASGWAAEASEREAGPAGRAADWMLRAAAPRPGERVLELACGSAGLGLAAAARVAPDGEVVLSDVAAEMTAIAAARAAALGGDAREAARATLSDGLARGLRVRARGTGTVEVTLRVPRVLGLRLLGETSATAYFQPQR